MRAVLLAICVCAPALAQGTDPKPKAEDYPIHGNAEGTEIGAEYMVHSFSRGEESYIARDYLSVEVALYPAKGQTLHLSESQFTLRVNGKKQAIQASAPTMVAASLTHPEWGQPSHVQLSGGVPGGPQIGIGQPRPPQIPQTPIPGTPNPPVDIPRDNGGVIPRERVKPEQLVVETALPEGEHKRAASGFVYFPYSGKTTGIKSLELIYEGAVLKLR
jgi:hypothetical protein